MAKPLTNAQKAALAKVLISKAADIVSFWDETVDSWDFGPDNNTLEGITQDQASEQLGKWLYRLPGVFWDYTLKDPQEG